MLPEFLEYIKQRTRTEAECASFRPNHDPWMIMWSIQDAAHRAELELLDAFKKYYVAEVQNLPIRTALFVEIVGETDEQILLDRLLASSMLDQYMQAECSPCDDYLDFQATHMVEVTRTNVLQSPLFIVYYLLHGVGSEEQVLRYITHKHAQMPRARDVPNRASEVAVGAQ